MSVTAFCDIVTIKLLPVTYPRVGGEAWQRAGCIARVRSVLNTMEQMQTFRPTQTTQERRLEKIQNVITAIEKNKWKSLNEFLLAF